MREQQEHEDEAAELRLLRAMLERSTAVEQKSEGWNASPFRPVPYALRGLRPMHTMEPWAQQVMDINKKQELRPASAYSTSGLARLDDGMNDSVAMLRRRKTLEDLEFSSVHGRPVWDNTVWHYCPPALRKIKPVTREPWQRDLEAYQARDPRPLEW